MKTLIVIGLAVILLAGCSTPSVVTNPIISPFTGKILNIPSLAKVNKQFVDAACIDVPFASGWFDRIYINKMKELPTQTTEDIAYFKNVCSLEPDARTPYQYGYVVGSFQMNTLTVLKPFLGSDALQFTGLLGI